MVRWTGSFPAPVVQTLARDGKNHDVSGVNGQAVENMQRSVADRQQAWVNNAMANSTDLNGNVRLKPSDIIMAPYTHEQPLARDGKNHDTTGVTDPFGGKSYNNMGTRLPNTFAQDVGRWGFGSAFKQHLPGWGQWLGASTMTNGTIPNWAALLGILGAGGLSAYGLKKLVWGDNDKEKRAAFSGIAKEAMARAMRAQDPAYMGTVTSSHPDVTAGNGLARMIEAIRTHENGHFGPNLPTQR